MDDAKEVVLLNRKGQAVTRLPADHLVVVCPADADPLEVGADVVVSADRKTARVDYLTSTGEDKRTTRPVCRLGDCAANDPVYWHVAFPGRKATDWERAIVAGEAGAR